MRRDPMIAVGEMLARASMQRAELYDDDHRMMAGGSGQTSVAR